MTLRFPTLLLCLLAALSLLALPGTRTPAAANPSDAHPGSSLPHSAFRLPHSEELRFDGEYGLWVQEAGRNLEVRWLTQDNGAGFLEALVGDRVVYSTKTPLSASHLAVFPRPRGNTVVLRYGASDDPRDRHQTTLYLNAGARRAGASFNNVDSVFVVGDTHGEYDTLIRLLRNTGVIGDDLRWRAGRAHLVLLGDIFDRGPDVTRLLWFVYGLERQAEQARGRVHVVLGNHEIMVMLDDLRYVAPKESMIAHRHGTTYSRMFDVRQSILGQWLATKPAILRINDVLYAHGGVAEDYLSFSLQSYDETLAALMKEDLFYRWSDSTFVVAMAAEQVQAREDFFWGENSAFWFRGYVRSDTLGDALARVLRHHRSNLHVVAHTPVQNVQERYQGALIAVNTIPAATELLLLVREQRAGTRRYRWGTEGAPLPLSPLVTSLSP
jgi:hypothetical protein